MTRFFGKSRLLCVLLSVCGSSPTSAFSASNYRSQLLRPVSENVTPASRNSWTPNETKQPAIFGLSRLGFRTRRSVSTSRHSKKSSNEAGSGVSQGFFSRLGGGDEYFNIQTTFSLVGGQAVLVAVAVAVAALAGTPNFGFGPGIAVGGKSIGYGLLMTLPLGALAWILDRIEEKVPALQDVTTATQRSVLALLGSTFKPGLGLFVAVSLGIAAGLGEEMLFRGILQYELLGKLGNIGAVGVSSVIFGLLHAVTPMYAFLATLASFYFGWLYLDTQNLVVPIVTHAVYDIGALLYAHWTVAKLSPKEQTALAEWTGPGEDR